MKGSLSLRAGIRGGHTVLLQAQGTYPLQVVRPHAGLTDGSLSLVLLLLSGGLLDGDEVAMDVVLEPGARLSLRTQAATQVHAGRSRQTLCAAVGQNAWFSYVPHCVVPHAAADFYSQLSVHMQPGARVLVADALAPGRTRYGEQFAYTRLRLDLDVWCGAELWARERVQVLPEAGLRGAQLGPATHTAGAYLLGTGPPPCLQAGGTARIGSSQLARGGWYVRALSQRAADLDEALGRLHSSWWSAG